MGYLQYQEWEYLPIASNSPTSWSSTTLPPGFTFNTTTGAITGAGTTAGLYMVNLVATNGAGDSDPVTFTIRIEPSSATLSSDKSGAEFSIDVGTGQVTFSSSLVLKEDDDQMLFITFTKNGNVLDLGTLTELKFTIKEFEPENTLVIGSAFKKLGTGQTTIYQLYVLVESSALKGAISNYENSSSVILGGATGADIATLFNAVCEIEWKEPNPDYAGSPSFGPATIRRSTALFTVPICRNETPA